MKTNVFCAGLLACSLLTVYAATASPAAKLRYAGSVVDAAGIPVSGVTVDLYQFGTGFSADAEKKPVKTVTTAKDGRFEFDAPSSSTVIFAWKQGLAPAWSTTWNPTVDFEEQLVLTTPGIISGVVVDEADKPLPDALVWLTTGYSERTTENGRASHYLPAMPHRELFSARSGSDGKFQIKGCPTNAAFDLGLTVSGKVLRDIQRQYVSPETMRWRSGLKDLKLVAEPAGSVEGKIRSFQSGEPIRGASISLQPVRSGPSLTTPPVPVTSKSDGTFRFSEVVAGAYRVFTSFDTNGPRDLAAEHVSINVAAGKATRDIEVAALKAGFVEVKVVGRDDQKPLAEVNLNASSPNYGAGAITDEKGLARLTLTPGVYQISAYRQNTRASQNSVTVEPGSTNQVQMEMESPRSITGLVLDPNGKPAAGLAVRVLPEWRLNLGAIKTDAEGRFSFPWNPSGSGGPNETSCVVVRDTNRNLAVAEDLSEETRQLELKLQPGLVVTGRIEDAQGKSLTNGTVQVFFWAGNSGFSFENKPVRADSQGKFVISGLPPGRRYSTSATAKGYGSQSQEIRSEDAEKNRIEVAPFALNVADKKLSGQVVDTDDKPVAGAWVNMNGQGQPNGSTRTDNQGYFTFEEVCEGSVQLFASTQGSYGNVRADAGDTNVLLKLGVNSYSVRETPRRASLVGKPLPGLTEVGLAADCVPAGKPILLCLIDVEQRPSRRFLSLLAGQHDQLRQKGISVIALQAAISSSDGLKEWKEANPLPFQIGNVTEKSKEAKWILDVESFPWLILTDKGHKVSSEGFPFEELEAKMKAAIVEE